MGEGMIPSAERARCGSITWTQATSFGVTLRRTLLMLASLTALALGGFESASSQPRISEEVVRRDSLTLTRVVRVLGLVTLRELERLTPGELVIVNPVTIWLSSASADGRELLMTLDGRSYRVKVSKFTNFYQLISHNRDGGPASDNVWGRVERSAWALVGGPASLAASLVVDGQEATCEGTIYLPQKDRVDAGALWCSIDGQRYYFAGGDRWQTESQYGATVERQLIEWRQRENQYLDTLEKWKAQNRAAVEAFAKNKAQEEDVSSRKADGTSRHALVTIPQAKDGQRQDIADQATEIRGEPHEVAARLQAIRSAGDKAIKTSEGFTVLPISGGKGPLPREWVKLDYQGWSLNGTKVVAKMETVQLSALARMNKCLAEGVRKTPQGGKSLILCPPREVNGTAVVYDVEVLQNF